MNIEYVCALFPKTKIISPKINVIPLAKYYVSLNMKCKKLVYYMSKK